MKKPAYQREPGDYEIRFLKDGRVVFVAPDQTLLDLAHDLAKPSADTTGRERTFDDTTETDTRNHE